MTARQRAIDAGLYIFSHYGFRQASMELVAERLGVSRQALYRHFDSKEALLSAVAADLHAGGLAAGEKAALEAQAAGCALPAIIAAAVAARFEHIMAHLATSSHTAELLEEHSVHCGGVISNYTQRFILFLEGLVAQETREGRFTLAAGLSASDVARYVFFSAKGLKSQASISTLNVDIGDVAKLVTTIVLGAKSHDDGCKSV